MGGGGGQVGTGGEVRCPRRVLRAVTGVFNCKGHTAHESSDTPDLPSTEQLTTCAFSALSKWQFIKHVDNGVMPSVEVGEALLVANIVGNLNPGRGVVRFLAKKASTRVERLAPSVSSLHLQTGRESPEH